MLRNLTLIAFLHLLMVHLLVIFQNEFHLLFGWFPIITIEIVMLFVSIAISTCCIIYYKITKLDSKKYNIRKYIFIILSDMLIIAGWLYYIWLNLMRF